MCRFSYLAALAAAAASVSANAAPRPAGDGIRDALAAHARGRVDAYRGALAAGATTPVLANTTYGPVLGTDDGNVTRWLGFPFAAPPTGPRRWASPEPPTPWADPVNATWWGPVCPQDPEFVVFGIFSGMSEDCLNMNVVGPSRAGGRTPPPGGWPVMVFFYGGGWLFGAGGYPSYMGFFPEDAAEDVVIVTFNYRVSVLGFLAGDPLKAASPDGSVGNWGLQDMRAAAAFMRANAAAFGGDPSRITIYGESAGGASVSHMLVNPRAWPSFDRAIIESGPMAAWISFPYAAAAPFYPQFAAAAGCPTTGAPSLACLRNVSWQALTDVDMLAFLSLHKFGPVVDGVEVLGDPRALAAAGRVAPGVPVIIGSNQDEGSMFGLLDGGPGMNASAYAAALGAQFGPALGAEVLAAYPAAAFPSPWDALVRVLGDYMMTCPTRDTARWLTDAGRAGGPAPVYTYLYTHANAVLADMMAPLGVCHGAELLNVWNIRPLLLGPGERALGDAWVGYWSNFAATGDPNGAAPGGGGATLPRWEPYGGAAADSLALIDTGAGGSNVTNAAGVRAAECDFWAARHGAAVRRWW
jgi:para-nitrobenzyl esterase